MSSSKDRPDSDFGQTTPLGVPKQKKPENEKSRQDFGQTTPLGPAQPRKGAEPPRTVMEPDPGGPQRGQLPPTVAASRTGTGGRGGLHGYTFEPGDVLSDRYEVIRFIAKGGMGEVYEARDLELKEVMALKTIRPDIAGEGEVLQRFKREIQLARRVSHPNVCRIFDLFHHEIPSDPPVKVAFLTMEILRGENLSDRLLSNDGPMKPAEAFPIVQQIAGALEAAHELGIVHRDLKAGNVMLVPRPSGKGERVVVTDFGLAKGGGSSMAATLTMEGAAMGTPAYMAPEQLEGGQITTAVDIYALGVLIYEMVTGTWPFVGDTALSTAIKRLKEPPPSPRVIVPELDVRWEQAILRCLERDPEKRFQRASDLIDFLTAAEPKLAAAKPAAKKRRGALPLGLVVVVAIALGVVFGPRFLSRTREAAPVEEAAQAAAVEPSAPATRSRPAYAVFDLKNTAAQAADDWLSTALAEMLATELGAGGHLRRIPGEDVARATIELELPATSSFGAESLEKIRNVLGCDLVVTGGFIGATGEAGDLLRVDVSLFDTETGEGLTSAKAEGSPDQLFGLVATLGGELRKALELDQLTQEETEQVRAATPASSEAARLFAEGLEKLRAFDALGAKELLAKAAEAEPESASIQAALAKSWRILGHDAEARKAADRALALSEPLSRDDQLEIEALQAEMSNQWIRAVEVYSTLTTYHQGDLEYGLAKVKAQVAAGQALEADVTLAALRGLPAGLRDDPRVDLAEASVAEALSEYPRQRDAAAHAVDQGTRRGARLLVARGRLAQAPALRRLGDLAGSRAAAAEAKEIFEAAGDRIGVAEAVNQVANSHYFAGELEQAEALWQEFLDISKETGQRRGEARALNNLALIQQARGDLTTALAMNNQSLALRRQIGDLGGEAMALNNIANLVKDQGRVEEAERLYRESLAIRREIGDDSGVATSLNNIASLLASQGRLEDAWEMLEEALEIKRRIGEKTGIAMALNNLGNVLHRKGDLSAAADSYRESLGIKEEIGEKGGVARAASNLATVTLEMGDPRTAEKLFEQSRKLALEMGDERGEAAAEYGIGEVHALRGYVDDARRSHNQALAIRTRIGDTGGIAQSRWALAVLAIEEGRPEEAAQAARQVLGLLESSETGQRLGTFAVLARAELAAGNLESCRDAVARAREIPVEETLPPARLELEILAARVADEGERPAAIAQVEDVEKRAAERGLVLLELEARFARAALEEAAGNEEKAKELYLEIADRANEAGLNRLGKEAGEAAGEGPRAGRRPLRRTD